MDKFRYAELESGITDAKLTRSEIDEGWHFCREWDGMLVGPGMPEMKACGCFRNCSTCGED